MRVVIDSWTLDPMGVVGRQAGVCYGRTDPSERRVRRCFEAGGRPRGVRVLSLTGLGREVLPL